MKDDTMKIEDISCGVFEKWLNDLTDARRDENNKWIRWPKKEKNADIKKMFGDKTPCGYESYYSCENKEFLYDLTWVKHGEDKHGKTVLLEVALAMELEFSDGFMGKGKYGGIKFDFNKLLQTNAKFKLMGFQMKTKTEVDDAIAEMERAIEYYKPSSKVFIFGWAYGEAKSHDYRFILSEK